MLKQFIPLDFRRKSLLKKVPDGALKQFYQTPFPSSSQTCQNVEYIALDFETTGLDKKNDEILSAGYVGLSGLEIKLATARHQLVKPDKGISEQSIIIHNITHEQADAGSSVKEMLDTLLDCLAGKVLIAHHASVEMGFLKQACWKVYGTDWLIPVIDTQELAIKYRQKRNITFTTGAMRLAALREHYHLPRYKAHNALTDAIATSELFLALLSERDINCQVPLSAVLSRF